MKHFPYVPDFVTILYVYVSVFGCLFVSLTPLFLCKIWHYTFFFLKGASCVRWRLIRNDEFFLALRSYELFSLAEYKQWRLVTMDKGSSCPGRRMEVTRPHLLREETSD